MQKQKYLLLRRVATVVSITYYFSRIIVALAVSFLTPLFFSYIFLFIKYALLSPGEYIITRHLSRSASTQFRSSVARNLRRLRCRRTGGKKGGTGVRWASRPGRGAISTNYREGRQRRA